MSCGYGRPYLSVPRNENLIFDILFSFEIAFSMLVILFYKTFLYQTHDPFAWHFSGMCPANVRPLPVDESGPRAIAVL